MQPQPNPFISLIPITVLSIGLAIVCFRVAKEKGRNAGVYLVLGLIPFVNGLAAFYLLAAPDLRLHAKIDRLNELLSARGPVPPESTS